MLRALLVLATPLAAQALPPLPDPAGVGTHVLALARAPDGAVWVGTSGGGIYVMRLGAAGWEQIRHSADTAARSISWDFVHAFAFGPGGEIWYGTVGNGWGLSTDGGKTWTNWDLKQLGPEWQYRRPHRPPATGAPPQLPGPRRPRPPGRARATRLRDTRIRC